MGARRDNRRAPVRRRVVTSRAQGPVALRAAVAAWLGRALSAARSRRLPAGRFKTGRLLACASAPLGGAIPNAAQRGASAVLAGARAGRSRGPANDRGWHPAAA